MRALLRDRVLDAAREITTARGWSALTMGAVASRVGVSRQHLYKEIGTKETLGAALVSRETERFLDGIVAQVRAHPADPVAGLVAAVGHALDEGSTNTLLKAILTADDARGESLLPLLTARPDAVLGWATERVAAVMTSLYTGYARSPAELGTCADGIVRLVLSHLTQPSGPPELVITQVRWLIGGVLDPSRHTGSGGPPAEQEQ